jgi:ABC-type polysaccharide/polyol phosphate export permease
MSSALSVAVVPFENVVEFGRTLYQYREYLKQSVARDLRKAYKRSTLGYLWSMLNPLLMMLIISSVFSVILRIQVEHYSVFLFAALMPWQYFNQTILGGLDSIRANRRIIEHLPIPKYIFILSLSFSNLANFLLALVPFIGVSLFVGKGLAWSMLALPLIILPLMMVSVGVALFFATMNVFFDDTRHLTVVLLQALYYLTPIMYGMEHLPSDLARWLQLNPMYHIIGLMRSALYFGSFPSSADLLVAYGLGVGVLMVGLAIFRSADSKFMYFL